LLGERHFDFDFTQAFDQRFHASRTQRLDQLVGGSFMSIRQKNYVTRHLSSGSAAPARAESETLY
jgi:hypothetical protein